MRPAFEHGTRPAFIRYNYFAESLDDLRIKLGVHGEAGVAMARWDALTSWLVSANPCLPHPKAASYVASSRCRNEDYYRMGLPGAEGTKRTPALADLNPDDRCEAIRVAADTMKAWEDAGSPGITPARCKQTQQFITAVVLMAEANANPPLTQDVI